MRNLLSFLLFAALTACGPAPQNTASGPPDEPEIAAGVTALVNDWAQAGPERRWEELKDLYADTAGFTWIERGGVAYADHAAITAGIDQASQMEADISSRVNNIRVTPLAPDAAAVVANLSLSVSFGDFGYDFDGIFSGVAIKRNDKWRFLQGHMSEPAAETDDGE